MSNDNKFTFNWTIKNYSLYHTEKGVYIESPEFLIEKFGFTKWSLKLYTSWNKKFEKFLSIEFNRNDGGIESIRLNEKIDLLTVDGSILKSKSYYEVNYEVKSKTKADDFFSINELNRSLNHSTEDTIIIRYDMEMCENLKYPNNCEAITDIGCDKCSFKWNINFPDNDTWLECKQIPFPEMSPIEIQLSSLKDDILTNISLLNNECKSMIYIRCKISLLDIKGGAKHFQIATQNFNSSESKSPWLFPSFIRKSFLKRNEQNFLTNGIFSIMCEISLSNEIPLSQMITYDSKHSNKSETFIKLNDIICLTENLKNLFRNKKHADVQLRLYEKEFPAHKCVLVARSPIFSTMFDQDMTESQTGIINIEGIEEDILDKFLCFLYTGTIEEIDHEMALKLLVVADKYQVQSLKEKCSFYLSTNFTENNICEILITVDMLEHNDLKVLAIEFIERHRLKILNSTDWLNLVENNIKLGIEVLCKISIDLGSEKNK